MKPTTLTHYQPTFKHYLLLCAAIALWIDFSHAHRTLNSDSLLFSIASLYAWTPFFWEQDRIGMFVPLLTTWCSDPMTTLLMQTAITTFIGLALPLVLVEFVYPTPAGRLGAMLANALMLALAPDRIRANLLFECCYPQAMFLGCVGLLVLGSRDRPRWWRYPIAFGLFVLAHWTYLGVIVWLMPLACWKAIIRPELAWVSLREFLYRLVRYFPGWSSLLLLGGAAGLGFWFMHLANAADEGRIVPTAVESLPPGDWPKTWRMFWVRLSAWDGMPSWQWSALGAAAVGLVAMMGPRCRPGYSLPAACLILAITGATEFLFMGTRGWPALNEYHFRYIIGSIICMQMILAIVTTAPLGRWIADSGSWAAFAGATVLLAAAAFVQYGFPTPGTPRTDLDVLYGERAVEVREATIDAIGGDYWTIWPLFLYMEIATSSDRNAPYPITFRSTVFRRKWESTHPNGLRVAVIAGSEAEKAEFFRAAKDQGLSDPIKVSTRDGLDIYFTRPVSAIRASTDR